MAGSLGLNCTFMELKGAFRMVGAAIKSRLNCTFMELKEDGKGLGSDEAKKV